MAHRNAILAAPAPVSVHGAIAEIDFEARRVAAKMRDDRLAIGRQIIGVDRFGDVAGGVTADYCRIVDRGDGDVDRAGSLAALLVDDRVGEAVRAEVVLDRDVAHGAVRVEGRGAVRGSLSR